jgi:hypothetical protein
MSTKVCKTCHVEKLATEFTANRAVCKLCRNKKEADNRKILGDTSGVEPEIPEKALEMLNPLQLQIQKLPLIFLEAGSTNEKLDKLMNALQAAFLTASNIKNGIIPMTIKVKMSPQAHVFLSQVFEDGGSFMNAKGYLNSQDLDGFKKHFKVPLDSCSKQEIDDLEKVTSFVKVTYQLLLEEWVTHNSKYSTRVAKVEAPLIELDADNEQIVITKNPLELSVDQFKAALVELSKSNSFTFSMYEQHGIYKKFLDLSNTLNTGS